MTSLTLLVVLLALAYLGGLGSARRRALHLGGGAVLAVGFALGPDVLGLISRDLLGNFQALLFMGMGWLGTVWGLSHGTLKGAKIRARDYVLANLLCAFGSLVIFGAAVPFARFLELTDVPSSWHLGLAVAAVLSGTTRVPALPSPNGAIPVTPRRIFGATAELPPVLLLAIVAVVSPDASGLPLPSWTTAAIGGALGVALGAIVAALLGQTLHRAELWPLLIGAALLTVGLTLRFEIPLLTPSFLFGVTLALLSPHKGTLRHLTERTERPMLLPALVLAGAVVTLPWNILSLVFCTSLVALRLGTQALIGWLALLLLGRYDESNPRPPPVAAKIRSFLPSSSLHVAIGLSIFLRHQDSLGQLSLFCAVLSLVVSDLLAATSLFSSASLELGRPEPKSANP